MKKESISPKIEVQPENEPMLGTTVSETTEQLKNTPTQVSGPILDGLYRKTEPRQSFGTMSVQLLKDPS